MLNYESKNLICIKEYDKLLDQINFTFRNKNLFPKVTILLEENESEILKIVFEKFKDSFPFGGFDVNYGFEYDVYGFEKIEGFIEHHSVLSSSKNQVSVELVVPIKCQVNISYEDTSSAFYDREDRRLYNVKSKDTDVYIETTLRVIVDLAMELDGKTAELEGWEFKEIISGVPTNLEIDA